MSPGFPEGTGRSGLLGGGGATSSLPRLLAERVLCTVVSVSYAV